MCNLIKQTLHFDSFKITHYQNDKDGMIVFYRKNFNGEFHRAIKIKKQELIKLATLIEECDNEV